MSVPASEVAPEELAEHLVRSTSLSASEARRVIDDVLGWFDEDVPSFVRRRHAELQAAGRRNPVAFEQIATELRTGRFVAPELSLRQLRRIVYT